jgi:hypothetical protein
MSTSLPGANTPTVRITAAQTPNDILAAAETDPQLDAILTEAKSLGATPIGAVLGMGLLWLAAHLGFTIPPDYVPVICGLGLIVGHYFQTKIWPGIVTWWNKK